jgi:hypothetical protein
MYDFGFFLWNILISGKQNVDRILK